MIQFIKKTEPEKKFTSQLKKKKTPRIQVPIKKTGNSPNCTGVHIILSTI